MALMRMMVKELAFVAVALVAAIPAARAEDKVWRHGVTLGDTLKYPQGFARFDYVNPDAPKGGTLRLSADGTFDTFNPVLSKGEAAAGVSVVFDTLLKESGDEVSTAYGLLAEAVSYPDDMSEVTFRLRSEARWADGQPVTPADVIFSLEKLREHNPLYSNYYRHVTEAVETGPREVTFRFDEKNNRELPQILGQFPIVPKHWWEGTGPDGKPRDISRTTLEPVMGSGAYRIAAFSPGATIRYELRDDYWAKDLPVNIGQDNFGAITYTYFGDRDVEFEAFRAGNTDYWYENMAARWATGYDFPAVKDGRVIREEVENPFRATGVMQALAPNLRRAKFQDERVRAALNYAFDFEELNRTIAFSAYKRVDSFFWGTELASSGLPEGREKEILDVLKDKVPARVFTTPYTNPVGGDPTKSRENLRKAIALFKEAGYELKGNRMVNARTGEPFSFEILLSSPTLERWSVPYAQNLKKIGVEASIRTVDAAQYTNRVRAFDYDVTWVVWAQTLHPGNEQSDYWGSASVAKQGSKNYAGIADPAIDELIRQVTFAQTRAELVPAVHALDRVLLAHNYVMPLFYGNTARLAYSSQITHAKELPYYGTGFPDAWWSTAAGK